MPGGFSRAVRGFAIAFAILGTALALHILPVLIFRPAPSKPAKTDNDRRFNIMIGTTPDSFDDPYDLCYWLRVGDKPVFSSPDRGNGFGAYVKLSDDNFLPNGLPDLTRMVSLSRKVTEIRPDTSQLDTPRPLKTLPSPDRIPMPRQNVIFSNPDLKTIPAKEVPSVFDRNGFFIPDVIPSTVSGTPPPRYYTVLSVRYPSASEIPPEVRVVRPSGRPVLDASAQSALTAFAVKPGAKKFDLDFVTVIWNNREKSK